MVELGAVPCEPSPSQPRRAAAAASASSYLAVFFRLRLTCVCQECNK